MANPYQALQLLLTTRKRKEENARKQLSEAQRKASELRSRYEETEREYQHSIEDGVIQEQKAFESILAQELKRDDYTAYLDTLEAIKKHQQQLQRKKITLNSQLVLANRDVEDSMAELKRLAKKTHKAELLLEEEKKRLHKKSETQEEAETEAFVESVSYYLS